jgi:hypothetical protein
MRFDVGCAGGRSRSLHGSRFVAASAVLVLMLSAFLQAGSAGAQSAAFSPYVSDAGVIRLPTQVRETWHHLGTWAAFDEKSPAPGFHDVYTQPGTVAVYRETGAFPDGAVLVKEIRVHHSGPMTTGHVAWPGEVHHWFVMIKDAKGRFPDHPNWGNGWGWGLFYPADPSKNASTSWQKDCLGCHAPAQATDWIYVQGYPQLHEKEKP